MTALATRDVREMAIATAVPAQGVILLRAEIVVSIAYQGVCTPLAALVRHAYKVTTALEMVPATVVAATPNTARPEGQAPRPSTTDIMGCQRIPIMPILK